ncbi:MAG: hypothetical protein V4563_17470 [Pseudomonadota bacterium]
MIDKDTVWDIRQPEDRKPVIDGPTLTSASYAFTQYDVGDMIYIPPRPLRWYVRFWYRITFRKPPTYPAGYYQITSVTNSTSPL